MSSLRDFLFHYLFKPEGNNDFLTVAREVKDGVLLFELVTFFDAGNIDKNRQGMLLFKS